MAQVEVLFVGNSHKHRMEKWRKCAHVGMESRCCTVGGCVRREHREVRTRPVRGSCLARR